MSEYGRWVQAAAPEAGRFRFATLRHRGVRTPCEGGTAITPGPHSGEPGDTIGAGGVRVNEALEAPAAGRRGWAVGWIWGRYGLAIRITHCCIVI